MTDPTTFPPLQVRDYPVQWDWKTNDPNLWDENTHYERAVVELPNGYRASIVRTNRQPRNSYGFEDGKWEVALVKENPDPLGRAAGEDYTDAPELADLATHHDENHPDFVIAGDLDNEGIQALLDTVAERPAVETYLTEADKTAPAETTEDELVRMILSMLLGGQVRDTEDGEQA